MGEMDDALPTIPGTTQTAEDTEPMMARLSREMARRPGGELEALTEGIESLQEAYLATDNPDVQDRIAKAIALLQFGSASADDEEPEMEDRDDEMSAPADSEPFQKPTPSPRA